MSVADLRMCEFLTVIETGMGLWTYRKGQGDSFLILGLAVVVQARPAKSRWAVVVEARWRPW